MINAITVCNLRCINSKIHMSLSVKPDGSHYSFYHPSDYLKPWLKGYTFAEGFSLFTDKMINAFPTGFPELVIHYEDSLLQTFESSNQEPVIYKSSIVGTYPLFHPHRVKLNSVLKMMSIIFTNEGLSRLFHTPLKELPWTALDISDLIGDKSKGLIDNISNARTNEQRVKIIERFFALQLHRKPHRDPISPYLKYIMAKRGNTSVNDICEDLYITRRTLIRLFQKHIHMSPKEYIKISRFNHACSLLMTLPCQPWPEIIDQCGYYDQSHVINEFKAVLKDCPTNILGSNNKFVFIRRACLMEDEQNPDYTKER